MFNEPQLEKVAQEVEGTILKIMAAAAQETKQKDEFVLSNILDEAVPPGKVTT